MLEDEYKNISVHHIFLTGGFSPNTTYSLTYNVLIDLPAAKKLQYGRRTVHYTTFSLKHIIITVGAVR